LVPAKIPPTYCKPMTQPVAAQHTLEVQKGERFEFGKNWRRFLSLLNDERIGLAEASLRKFLGAERLDQKTFLDIGSGSGLFSLAARRLVAKVHSFDYDTESVACTAELRRRYSPDDANWVIGQGSVLDRTYLAALGTFDIVYSWGVLHHTGAMWTALDNVKPLVRPGGQLFIAIYNDLGTVTDEWRKVKQTYNRLPSPLRLPFALITIARCEKPTFLHYWQRKDLMAYLRIWTQYSRDSTRGMSKWHDWIDWIGGYPYECATLEGIVDFFGKDGFALEFLESRAHGIGCNEFVFRRKADLCVFVDNPLPKSRFLVRQYGHRVVGPFRPSAKGYVARVPEAFRGHTPASLVLFHDGNLHAAGIMGDEPGSIVVAPPDWPEERLRALRIEVVRGTVRPIEQPLRRYRGHMYSTSFPELKHLADTLPNPDRSPVFVFEDERQLSFPHSIHDDIAEHGAGRFSHWGEELVFSASDNSDPRSNGRVYRLVIAEPESASENRFDPPPQ
jgi:2-polyprenyl-3-methyl-5-hydroxy-6-metoxy-1,4-benzoquinol methylase